jgi:hypothetical protein
MVRRGPGVQVPSSASAQRQIGTPLPAPGTIPRRWRSLAGSPARVLAELLSVIVVVILAMVATRVQYGQSVALDQFGRFVLYAVLAVCVGLPGIKFMLSWLLTGSPNSED